ncbi:MAG: SOS response-associated peptidase [Phycisphaerales bacterium]
MCGRYTCLFTWKQLQRLMRLTGLPEDELLPRFNVAPTQFAPAVRQSAGGARTGALLRWGLVPSWADDPSIGSRLINARGETVAEKPSFRSAFRARRCLIPVSGFYEWKAVEDQKAKRPFWIGRADREPFALAGLWERWTKGAEPVESFTIITTTPNALMAKLHDRMPVIVDPGDYDRWLDPGADPSSLSALIRPNEPEEFEAYPIGTRVNSPKNDDPSLLDPA